MGQESLLQKTLSRRDLLRLGLVTTTAAACSAFLPGLNFLSPFPVHAAETEGLNSPPDFSLFLPGRYEGHFYTQTRGEEPYPKGYAVINDDKAPVWNLFRRYGAVTTLGYPLSQRWNDEQGRVCQAFQRGIIQITPGEQNQTEKVEWMNILDNIGERKINLDNPVDMTPPSSDWSSDAGKSWEEIKQNHFDRVFNGLLKYPQLSAAYFSNQHHLELYGLPQGTKDYGNTIVLRCQRNNLQLWKNQTPWTLTPMEVTVALSGELALKYGLIPKDAAEPVNPPVTQKVYSQKYQAEIVLYKGDASSPNVYLTIDDFWDPAAAEVFLNMADARNIKVTFFPVGNRIAAAPDIFRRVAASGHGIENHTQNHSWLSELSDAGIRAEIRAHRDTTRMILGDPAYMQHFLRPPGGAGIFNYDPRIPVIARQEGLKVAMWSADSNGWRMHPRTDNEAKDYVMRNIRAGLGRGAIVLQHGVASDMAVFGRLIDEVLSRGLNPIAMSEGIK